VSILILGWARCGRGSGGLSACFSSVGCMYIVFSTDSRDLRVQERDLDQRLETSVTDRKAEVTRKGSCHIVKVLDVKLIREGSHSTKSTLAVSARGGALRIIAWKEAHSIGWSHEEWRLSNHREGLSALAC
jgi:hypothetical protein